jgi:hypothetical protein
VRDVDLHSLGAHGLKHPRYSPRWQVADSGPPARPARSGTVALTRALGRCDFGVFAIVSPRWPCSSSSATPGVGGALVRQREEPTDRQLASVLYLQLAMSAGMMAVTMAVAGWLRASRPDLPASAPLLLRVMAVDFLLVSSGRRR